MPEANQRLSRKYKNNRDSRSEKPVRLFAAKRAMTGSCWSKNGGKAVRKEAKIRYFALGSLIFARGIWNSFLCMIFTSSCEAISTVASNKVRNLSHRLEGLFAQRSEKLVEKESCSKSTANAEQGILPNSNDYRIRSTRAGVGATDRLLTDTNGSDIK